MGPLELILVLLLVGAILWAVARGRGGVRRGPRSHYRRGTYVRNRRLF